MRYQDFQAFTITLPGCVVAPDPPPIAGMIGKGSQQFTPYYPKRFRLGDH